MKRRDFVKSSIRCGSAAIALPMLGTEQPSQKFKIGMAATTWVSKTPTIDSYWTAIEAISELNIGATEADDSNAHLVATYSKKPQEFIDRSNKLGVYLAGVFQSLYLSDPQRLSESRSTIRSVAQFLRAVKAQYIALGWSLAAKANGKETGPGAEEIRRAARTMDEIGRLCLEEYGVFIALHAERDLPKDAVIQVLDESNPKYVRFCPDVGHLAAMGLDPLTVLKKYSSRIAVSHWKDFDPKLPAPSWAGAGATGDFVEPGTGIIRFRPVADFFRQIGYSGWVMLELDKTRLPSITASAQAMKAFVTDRLKLEFYPSHS